MNRRTPLLVALMVVAGASARADEIHDAALRGDVEKVRALVTTDPSLLTLKGRNDKLPLHWAAQGGNREMVALLLDRGADPNCRNNNDETPLHYAAAFNHLPVAELLLARGAEMESRSRQGVTPLMEAAEGGHQEVVRLLLGKGADSFTRDTNGRTAFDRMCMNGMWNLVKEQVAATPQRLKGEPGASALHAAAAQGNAALVDELLALGADARSRSAEGDTLLTSAAKGGLTELSRKLLDQGHDPKTADGEGRTALAYAVRANAPGLVELLVAKGADLNVRGVDGRSALDIAEDLGFTDLAGLLKKLGAKALPRPIHSLGNGKAGAGGPSMRADVAITYLGNEGFLISSGRTSVMVDAPQGPQNFGYVGVSDALFERMLGATPPFENVPLLMVSHAHADHFNAAMAARFLQKRGQTRLVGNAQVVEALEAQDKALVTTIQGRVRRIEPEWGKVITEKVNGIAIKVYPVNHGSPERPYKTCAYLFEVGGVKLFHLGDSLADSNAEYFKSFGLESEGIDIAFVDPFLLQNPAGRSILAQYIKPRAVILMHMRASEASRFLAELGPTTPNLHAFREPMEKQLFAK